jgi:hypothetical protein
VSELLRLYEASECGSDGYPLVWHKGEPAVKDLVREQAGHRCVRCQHPFVVGRTPGEWSPCDERCQHTNGEIRVGHAIYQGAPDNPLGAFPMMLKVHARWRVLTVHHLTGNKADLRWWNLAALCQRCHLEIQGRVRMEQVYPHEHSEWFKPYAAGYYAATYLGEDLTREQTEARLSELLSLELAAR